MNSSSILPFDFLSLTHYKRFVVFILMGVLMLAGTMGAEEKAPQQGVEFLFPAGTGKQAGDANLSMEESSLLQKLKDIEKGGEVNAVDEHGQTALMHAAEQGNKLAVCWLVVKGADATMKSQQGKTAAELAKDKSLQAFLKACCVDKQPLSAEEEKQLQEDRSTDRGAFLELIRQCGGKDSPKSLKLLTQLLRSGSSLSLMEGIQRPALDPLLATLLSRHGYSLVTEGQRAWGHGCVTVGSSGGHEVVTNVNKGVTWTESNLRPELALLLMALNIKLGNDDALSQAGIAMLLDDADALRKVVTEHPDLVRNRLQASQIIAGLGTSETLQVLIDAGLDPKLTWDGLYKDSKECFIQDILNSGRRSAAGIRALAAAGAPLPVLHEQPNLLTADMEEHSYTCSHMEDQAYDPEVIDALIEAGADVNAVGSGEKSGLPPLVLAATRYGEQAVSHLLSKGAQVNTRWVAPGTLYDGQTALYSAVAQGNLKVVRLLLQKGADTKATPKNGLSILKLAVGSGNYHIVKMLLKHGVPMEDDVLQCLPTKKLTLFLLKHGAKLPSSNVENGYTPLMHFAWMSKNIAKQLLDNGADPNALVENKGFLGDGVKLCALGITLQHGRSDIAKYLQQRGAKMVGDLLLAKPKDMRAMLEAGASVPKDLFKKLKFATIPSSPTAGQPPKLTQEELTEAAKIMRDAGAKPTMNCIWGGAGDAAGIAACLAVGADPNEKYENKHNDNYIFLSLMTPPDPKITKSFIKAGVNVNLQDKEGNTALMLVCQKGQGYDGHQEVLSLLLDAGADPNIKNKNGKTALQIAQEKNSDEFVKLLKKHGAKE